MKKTVLILMIMTICVKVTGFGKTITLSYFYGVSYISDAYLISLIIPNTIFTLIGTGIITSYIPLYSELEKEKGVYVANKFTSNVVNFIILLCALIILVVLIFTTPIVKLFAMGFKGEGLKLAVNFTRISIFGICLSALIYVFKGYLNLKGDFIIPELIIAVYNLLIIVSIVISSKVNIIILSIGSIVATIFQFLFLIPFVYKQGYKYQFILDKNDEYLKRMISLSLPVILGVSVNQINVLVDRTIASKIAEGGISALTYANRLNLFIQSIFVLSISTAIYPMISKMAAENNIDGMKESVSEAINSITLLVIPATIGAMLFSEQVVKLLFGRGAFDSQAISMTSTALFYYSIGMLGFGLREILSKAFYSLQDTKTPMINAAIAMAMNIVLNIILSKYIGIGGLALATSISAIFSTVLLFISFRKKVGSFGMKHIIVSFIKVLCASLVMGIIARVSYNLLLNHISANLSLIAAIIIGAAVYFVIIYFMGIEEVDSMIEAVKNKLKRSPANG